MTTRAELSAAEERKRGHTALMVAALEGRTRDVKLLLDRRADVNAEDQDGRTALMFAVINSHQETVEILLDRGADVNAQAKDGATALILAAIVGSAEIVKKLLNKGADPDAAFTATGKTAMTMAMESGHPSIAHMLKSHANRLRKLT
jgi:uncharacterized protein